MLLVRLCGLVMVARAACGLTILHNTIACTVRRNESVQQWTDLPEESPKGPQAPSAKVVQSLEEGWLRRPGNSTMGR
jgi:hypothetical protein